MGSRPCLSFHAQCRSYLSFQAQCRSYLSFHAHGVSYLVIAGIRLVPVIIVGFSAPSQFDPSCGEEIRELAMDFSPVVSQQNI